MSKGNNFGKYELLEPIGTGGMAEVYKARLPGAHGLDKIVAIKRILPYYCEDRSFVQMFLDEAKITLSLNHPNIGQVYEVNQAEDDSYFIAMEFIDGPNLSHVLKRLRKAGYRMPLDLAIHIMTQVCAGLYTAHTQCDSTGSPMHIIHRDVSPHNVMVGRRGQVKLIDFGIAKAKDRLVQTQHGAVRGKLLYLSPEQASRAGLDARSDIFSAGMMFMTLINGVHIWRGKDEVEVLIELRNWTQPDIRSMRPNIDEDIAVRLQNVLARSTATNPGDRYPDAESFRIDLNQLLYAINPVFSPVALGKFISDTLEGRFEDAEPAEAGAFPAVSGSWSGLPRIQPQNEGFGSGARPRLSPKLTQRKNTHTFTAANSGEVPRVAEHLRRHSPAFDQTPSGTPSGQSRSVRALERDQTPSGANTPSLELKTPSGDQGPKKNKVTMMDSPSVRSEHVPVVVPPPRQTPPLEHNSSAPPTLSNPMLPVPGTPEPKPPEQPRSRTPMLLLGLLVFLMLCLAGVAIALVVAPGQNTGTLIIRSTPPGAAIKLNNEALGPVTPARIERVPAGEHTITLMGDKGRFETKIELLNDQELIVTGRLDNGEDEPKQVEKEDKATPSENDTKVAKTKGDPKEKASKTDTKPKDVKGPETNVIADTGNTPETPNNGTQVLGGPNTTSGVSPITTGGDLTTTGKSDAFDYVTMAIYTNVAAVKVSINGHTLPDRTGNDPRAVPLEVTGLTVGREYTVVAERRGYENATANVIADSERVTVRLNLKRKQEKPGFLSISTVPHWAQVFINGRKVANQTPLLQHRLNPGSYSVRLHNPEKGLTKSFKVQVKPGESTKKRIKF